MAGATVEWDGLEEMAARMAEYGNRVKQAVRMVADSVAPVIETEAKTDAPWRDRSSNARQGLRGFAEDVGETSVAIYLTHSVDYGVYLELSFSERYAIIMPTLEKYYPQIKQMLDDIFA